MGGEWEAEIRRWGTGMEDRSGGIGVVVNQIESRGSVTLRSSSPHDHPRIDPGYFADGGNTPVRVGSGGESGSGSKDIQALMFGIRRAVALAQTEPFASLIDWDKGLMGVRKDFDWNDDEALEAYIRQGGGTTWHYSCTCKMGDLADPMVVTDERLRVRNIDGLRVADASVMPQVRGVVKTSYKIARCWLRQCCCGPRR
jgi:choline dehydrogenase